MLWCSSLFANARDAYTANRTVSGLADVLHLNSFIAVRRSWAAGKLPFILGTLGGPFFDPGLDAWTTPKADGLRVQGLASRASNSSVCKRCSLG